MKCQTKHKGQECDCAGCWPNRDPETHTCPGCDQCTGPFVDGGCEDAFFDGDPEDEE